MRPQLIIPMSGFGERFRSFGYSIPKPLIQVAGHPMIAHVVEMYPDDIDVLFIVNEEHSANDQYGLNKTLRDLRPTAKIVGIPPHKLGPSWAIQMAEQFVNLDGPVVVNYCDFSCLWDYEGFVALLGQCDGVVATYTGFHPHLSRSISFAYVVGEGDAVTGIQEKTPFTTEPMNERASSGTYGFSSGRLLLDAIDEQIRREIQYGGEFYTSLTYRPLLDSDYEIRTFNINRFFQWGTPQDLRDFQQAYNAFEFCSSSNRPKPIRSKTVLIAAGKGSRFSEMGYQIPKASLPISGQPMWMQVLETVKGTDEVVIVARPEVLDRDLASSMGKLLSVKEITRGQAESALIGMSLLSDDEVPVTLASCDALFVSGTAENADSESEDFVVWAVMPNAKADECPEQFSWIKMDSEGLVTDFIMKARPPQINDWLVVSGTFTFSTSRIARSYIQTMIEEEIRTNNEFYLDNAILIALRRGRRVRASLREDYIGLGTPEEYESFRYWQGAFHAWGKSSYSIQEDRMVDRKDVSKLVVDAFNLFERISDWPKEK